RMAGFFWMLGLTLLAQGFLRTLGDIGVGCKKWVPDTEVKGFVKCVECHPGNRVVKLSGPNPEKLCTPCENGTYIHQSLEKYIFIEAPSHNTQCKCKEGLRCGDAECTFCTDECGKGEEPTKKRDCRPCPKGTFNDQIHQNCKAFSTRCPDPTHIIVFQGNASSDIICELPQPPTTLPVTNPENNPVKPGKRGSSSVSVELLCLFSVRVKCIFLL
uniref:TNFR-Cys domain-containing protein n=1 Tax=Poecilia mexicana TaxID=48701 RepID=A0A3B3YDR1_9TELE